MVDFRERYPYRFTNQQVRTTRRALRAGDYADAVGGRVAAAVERRSLPDLVSGRATGTLRYAQPNWPPCRAPP